MKRILLALALFIIVSLACDLSVTVSPDGPTPLPPTGLIPTTEVPTQISASPVAVTPVLNATPTALQRSFEGVEVTVAPLSVVLPSGLASGMRGSQVPRAEGADLPAWALTPGHTALKLEGYLLQGRTHEPQIYVYPAQAYAEMVPAAFERIHRLDNILYVPGGPTINDQLPAVPFFNDAQVFASNTQVISFQGGQGVRFLTQYAQYAAPANNHDLFYHFEGLTRDGTYFIVAILPISNPMLAETSDAGAPLPAGGVPYPYFADPDADMQSYYTSVVEVLNATPSEAFTPTLSQLDALIQSVHISQ